MNIQYAVYCEDQAQKLFLHAILPLIIQKNNTKYSVLNFESNEFRKLKPNNKSEVKKSFINASKIAFRDLKTELFILCFDADSPKEEDCLRQQHEWKEIISRENLPNKDKFVLAVPVQAIEHWLLYIRYIKTNSPKLKKGTLEQIPQSNLKEEIYQKDKYNYDKRDLIVSSLVSQTSADTIDSLRSNSISFNRFYSDVEKFLNQISP